MVEYKQSTEYSINKIVGAEPGFLNRADNKVNNELGYLFNRKGSNKWSRGYSRIEAIIFTCILGVLVSILGINSVSKFVKSVRNGRPLDAELVKKVVDIYDLDGTQSLDPNEVQKLLEDFKSREISNYSLEGFVEEHQQDLQQNSNAPY